MCWGRGEEGRKVSRSIVGAHNPRRRGTVSRSLERERHCVWGRRVGQTVNVKMEQD